MKRWIVMAIACVLMAGAAGAYTCDCKSDWLGPQLTLDQAAMLDVLEEYLAFRVNGDYENWIALWDENGVDMPADEPMRVGRQAILSALRGESARDLLDMEIVSQEICCAGNYGFIRGKFFRADKKNSDGGMPGGDGKFITIFRKQDDGSWLIYRNCFNHDSPEA